MSAHFAFVTLLTSDSYLPGVLAISGALKDVHQVEPQSQVTYDTVCLVTPETLDVSTIKLLRKAYDIVIGVEVIDQSDPAGLSLLGRPDLDTVLTKLHVFRLAQYSKIVFLDADVLPVRPLSHLFHLEHEFSAVPDVGWPDIFNSGVMVLSPGEDKFKELQELLQTKGTWDGGDQGLLNEWKGSNWNRLSFTYNTTPTAAYTYAPAYERFGSQISVVHFIGPNKPWHSIPYRAPGSSATQASSSQMEQSQESEPANKQPQRAYNYGSLVDRWYNVYDKHFRSKPITPDAHAPDSKFVSAWEDETNTGTAAESASSSGGSPFGLDVLRRLALQGMGAIGFRTGDRSHGEGEYKSMPLEGRVDLMRPRPAKQNQPEEHDSNQPETESADSNPDEAPEPRTPVQQMSSLPSGSPVRWTTLPTPNIDELPPAPYTRLLSLPPTPLHFPSPPSKPFVRENQPKSPLSLQERRMERSRPTSPPLLSWNAAVESPPKNASTPSAMPRDTYFPNIWDDSSSRNKDRATSSSMSSSSMSSETDATSTQVSSTHADPSPQTLFSPPPVPEIPQMLLQLGHYRNVTGSPAEGGAAPPTPDRTKVKRVFPWEERPRASPARVFPEDETPPPGSIFTQSPPRSAVPPSTPLRKMMSRDFGGQQPMPSPLAGFPSLTAGNMWDAVPGIHKFTSKLARPPGPTPLSSAFGDTPTKPWEEKSEDSSHDGDVEDEIDSGEDEDEDRLTVTKVRSRSSSITTAKKKYQSFGVQTEAKEMRSQSVQVSSEEDTTSRRSSRPRSQSISTKKQWQPSSSLRLPPVIDVATGAEPSLLSPVTPRASTPSGSVPVESAVGMVPSIMNGSMETLAPPKTPEQPGGAMLGVKRTETPSSRPTSPNEGQSPSASRRASRVWDPSRGVELFKRGSEEVLARFLKISSREESVF
ncbi:nucleotide-diphospho-sugar transferase [Rhizopogon salebrosus TDB-379]|nr:nucleotide-diphospho-sugar transferase [Rhizopogon salebrosus TDB-379]